MTTNYANLLRKFQTAEKVWLTHHKDCEMCEPEECGPSIYCTVGQELADAMDHYGLELQDSPEFIKNQKG